MLLKSMIATIYKLVFKSFPYALFEIWRCFEVEGEMWRVGRVGRRLAAGWEAKNLATLVSVHIWSCSGQMVRDTAKRTKFSPKGSQLGELPLRTP